MSDRKVVGGRAKITGATEGGPQKPRIGGAKLRASLSDSFPANAWIEFDCTPVDQNGKEFGPMPAGAEVNPEFEGVPTFDGDPATQALRLQFDYEGEGSVDLVHEYANHGCTPRIKAIVAHGTISNLRFVAAGGVVIPVSPPVIRVGLESDETKALYRR